MQKIFNDLLIEKSAAYTVNSNFMTLWAKSFAAIQTPVAYSFDRDKYNARAQKDAHGIETMKA